MTSMKPPLLFLDFDGVLHPTLCNENELFRLLPDLTRCLASAVQECQIVISSSWRFHWAEDEIVAFFPQELRHRIVGMTGPAVAGRHSRFLEIQAFVAAQRGVTNWRALDDSVWQFPQTCRELIACDGSTGFSAREANELRRWLAEP